MNCCIMLSLEFGLCLMHMFELFIFEFVVWMDLNSKEKIKRKGIRNFRIKEKSQSIPEHPLPRSFGPVGPARPRSLSARWGLPGRRQLPSHAHSLALCTTGLAYQHSLLLVCSCLCIVDPPCQPRRIRR
jgi:hypothetical protein